MCWPPDEQWQLYKKEGGTTAPAHPQFLLTAQTLCCTHPSASSYIKWPTFVQTTSPPSPICFHLPDSLPPHLCRCRRRRLLLLLLLVVLGGSSVLLLLKLLRQLEVADALGELLPLEVLALLLLLQWERHQVVLIPTHSERLDHLGAQPSGRGRVLNLVIPQPAQHGPINNPQPQFFAYWLTDRTGSVVITYLPILNGSINKKCSPLYCTQ